MVRQGLASLQKQAKTLIMSLDITLLSKTPITRESGTGIYIRENGGTRELTYAEAKERYPDADIDQMTESYQTDEVFSVNITHNLNKMASEAGIYSAMWQPEKHGWSTAADVAPALLNGILKLKSDPDHYRTFNPPNGWGSYENLVKVAEDYLTACIAHPDATIEVSR